MVDVWYFFFFFKQKTAYEMRISDWSSDVCSSDLPYEHSQATPGSEPVDWQIGVQRSAVHAEPGIVCASLSEAVAAWNARSAPGHGVIVMMEIGRASCRERVCQYV